MYYLQRSRCREEAALLPWPEPGNALGQMVANLTIGKKKYAQVEDEIKELAERMKGIQGQFTALADQDAKVFAPLAKCYSLPSGTEEEKGIQGRGHGSTAVGCQSCANGNHGEGIGNAGNHGYPCG